MITTDDNDTAARDAIIEAFENSLVGIGYLPLHIRRDYRYSDFLALGERRTVDLAAFGGAVASLRTCNIGISLSQRNAGELTSLRALGAPLLFCYDRTGRSLSRWRMSATGLPEELDLQPDITPDNFVAYFDDHRSEWKPEAFRQARTANFLESHPQLDFFDLGLLPALEGQLQRRLSDHIQNIAAHSRQIINERMGDHAFETEFPAYASLLFRLLAGRLLADRDDLKLSIPNADAGSVLLAVEKKYPDKGAPKAVLSNENVQNLVRNQIWDSLQNGLDLRNLSPETLAFVYENALVDSDLRRRNGIHSTPPQIADYLLRQLPVERLAEADRTVFEPFCGNAPFLLASMRRLHDLLPTELTPQEIHTYLVPRLLGMEILPIAREIAIYSLILGDYPNDNSWNVFTGDAFTDSRFDTFLKRANIVLCNPPHENFDRSARSEDGHLNRAAEALRRILLHPPALLGFVMPLSFVDAKKFSGLRSQLIKAYPDIAVTALPDSVFGNASQETSLIAAHRLDTVDRYVWSGVGRQDYEGVLLKPTWSHEPKSLPLVDGVPVLWRLVRHEEVAPLWEALVEHDTLDTLATIHRGLEWQKTDSETPSTSAAISVFEKPGFKPGLGVVNSAVEAYLPVDTVYLDTRKESLRGNSVQWNWGLPKVLVNSARISRGVWRICAIADTQGLFASQRFIGVWPRPDLLHSASPELLSAILNGPVANAFLHHRCGKRDNDVRVIKCIPVPSFTSSQSDEIEALVNSYMDILGEQADVPKPWRGPQATRALQALLKIDAAVLELYQLPDLAEAALLSGFDGETRSHLPFHFVGYNHDSWAAAKAALEDDRVASRLASDFFRLLEKRNLHGLSTSEQAQYEALEEMRESRREKFRAQHMLN